MGEKKMHEERLNPKRPPLFLKESIVTDIYTSMEEAREEIWRRWNDRTLRKKVEAFLGHVPDHMTTNPRAILNRDIATPDNEFREFIRKAYRIGLSPLVSEYSDDKFVGINPDKLSLAKMAISTGRDKNGGALFRYITVIDYPKHDGKKFSEIITLWGEQFVSFHHRLLRLHFPDVEVFDNSEWLKSKGDGARDFYPYELGLCICHGVLFEDFLISGAEKRFCEDVVMPTFDKLVAMFGIKPLIVPLLSKQLVGRDAGDSYWSCYPNCLKEEILSRLRMSHKNNARGDVIWKIRKTGAL